MNSLEHINGNNNKNFEHTSEIYEGFNEAKEAKEHSSYKKFQKGDAISLESLESKKQKIFNDKTNLLKDEFFTYEQKLLKFTNNLPQFIKEIKNSINLYFIASKGEALAILDQNYNIINEIKPKGNNWIYSICERYYFEDKNSLNLIICSLEETKLIIIKNGRLIEDKSLKVPSTTCIEVGSNNHIICGPSGAFHYIDLFDKTKEKDDYKEISNKSYKGAIKLDDKYVAITSNKILQNGEDKILFYNLITNQIFKEISGYSFNISPNGLCLMSNNENTYKVLLCACKKYVFGQKNGILLVNFDEDLNFDNCFYCTKDFEVYCFSQIFEGSDKILNQEKKKNKTNYFFAGGLEPNKGYGSIKLYKIEYNNKDKKIEIKNIQDFKLKKNYSFKGPINSIIQRKDNGKFIITCFDGYIHILSAPNNKSFSFYENNFVI